VADYALAATTTTTTTTTTHPPPPPPPLPPTAHPPPPTKSCSLTHSLTHPGLHLPSHPLPRVGLCASCAGTVSGSSLTVLPDLLTPTEVSGFNTALVGALGSTSGNRTRDLLDLINLNSQGGHWFCASVTDIAYSSSTPASITVKQLSVVRWTWTDLRNVQQGAYGTSTSNSTFSSGAVSVGGVYSRSFTTLGNVLYHSLADTSSTTRTLVVTDANECIGEGSPTCAIATRMCLNTQGSYLCLAMCGTNNSAVTCGAAQQSCQTYANTQACGCAAGYTGQDSCTDMNECALDIDTCNDPHHICTNTPGSFTCSCTSGYTVSGNSCADVNECSAGTHNCAAGSASCSNTAGSFTCSCNAGWSGNGVSCSDQNECVLGSDNCDDHAVCTNTAGSFTCACDSGYTGAGTACTNLNECALATHNCHANASCTDTSGSFTCACVAGFSGDGVACSDSNECSLHTDTCHSNATCSNTVGSFSCACNTGYVCCATVHVAWRRAFSLNAAFALPTLDNLSRAVLASLLTTITHTRYDNDDDDHQPPPTTAVTIPRHFHVRHQHRHPPPCVSLLGAPQYRSRSRLVSYRLVFRLVSYPIVSYCIVSSCLRLISSRLVSSLANFSPHSICLDTRFTGSGTSCADNNECTLDTDTCTAIQTCVNTVGSFTCGAVNECAIGTHNCHANATCTDTSTGVGFTCACNTGYTGTGTTCVDINECASFPCSDTCKLCLLRLTGVRKT
jgi:hypothetical protein